MAIRNAPDSFWARVQCGPGCWPWQGYRDRQGYGKLCYIGKFFLAHRLAWTLVNGDIPSDVFVCHRCDNPPCCNPDHLFLGTNGDNVRDAVQKGRWRTGSREGASNPRAKLTPKMVAKITAKRSEGATLASIAADLGVAPVTVRRVLAGNHWTLRQKGGA